MLAVSSHGQPFAYHTWAYSVPTDGGPGGPLPWGPVSDIAVQDHGCERRTLLLTGTPPHEPHAWKRYRGGATGRLWLHGERLVPDLDGHLACPMFVAGRIAFLSDHEGVGNLYSCRPDGSDLRRHTDHADFYARNAVHRRAAGRLPVRGRPVDGRRPRPRRGAAPAGLPPRRPPQRPPPLPGARRLQPRQPRHGPHRPGQRRLRPRQPVLAHPPRRPGPHHLRPAGRPRPAPGDARRHRPGRLCDGRRGRGRHRARPPARPRLPRPDPRAGGHRRRTRRSGGRPRLRGAVRRRRRAGAGGRGRGADGLDAVGRERPPRG